jgi:hypothetical protein
VLRVLSEAILAKGSLVSVDCRIGTEERAAQGYMRVGISMRYGPRGILAFIRPEEEEGQGQGQMEGQVAGGGASGGGVGANGADGGP